MDLLVGLLQPFVFNPLPCGVVAAAFTVALFLQRYSRNRKVLLGLAALLWWIFTITEATTSIHANIRLDLVFLGPLYLLSGAVGLACLVKFHERKG